MGRFDGYLFLSDMDGTLTYEGRVSPENQAAIRFFQEEGGIFTIATGRPPMYIRRFLEQVEPNTYVVAVNGAVIYDLKEDRAVWVDSLPEDAVDVIEYVQAHHPQAFSVHITNSFTDYSVGFDPKKDGGFRAFAAHLPGPWYKMIVLEEAAHSAEGLADLIEHFGDRFRFERSWPEGIEMHSIGSGKDISIRKLREFIPSVHTVLAAGDYENDIAMLREADIGYAMGNALDHVKKEADRVAPVFTEHAIAQIIYQLSEELNNNGNDEKTR